MMLFAFNCFPLVLCHGSSRPPHCQPLSRYTTHPPRMLRQAFHEASVSKCLPCLSIRQKQEVGGYSEAELSGVRCTQEPTVAVTECMRFKQDQGRQHPSMDRGRSLNSHPA